jgi:hypothetical protein
MRVLVLSLNKHVLWRLYEDATLIESGEQTLDIPKGKRGQTERIRGSRFVRLIDELLAKGVDRVAYKDRRYDNLSPAVERSLRFFYPLVFLLRWRCQWHGVEVTAYSLNGHDPEAHLTAIHEKVMLTHAAH